VGPLHLVLSRPSCRRKTPACPPTAPLEGKGWLVVVGAPAAEEKPPVAKP